ncbi:cellulase family glycosylhydrolase [Actinoplanes sp. NPDC020271]|uniref:cellulase family glycosylhydrolase n=1 Tax=Actinoplanes sp. NPDC020271 TaxID=3363896 RepID=UPI0037916081
MRFRRTSSVAAVGVLAATALVGVVLPASAAASGCSVNYTVTGRWQNGFQGSVAITNLGDPLTAWKLEFDFPDAGQKVTQGWNATWAQTGSHVTVTNASWNGSVPTGGSVSSLGFIGSFTSANADPTAFRVNGVACNGGTTTPSSPPPSSSSGPAPALHVSGNKLVTAAGKPYRLLGVNRSSGEFACVQGKGMWDGEPGTQANIDAMKAWNVHAVRIPLNEDCWLGTYGTPSGAAYQQEVKAFADALVANGINPILDLHWTHGVYTGTSTACADVNATCQKPMPDAEYAPKFWAGVAGVFKGNNAVLFDLFNEPYPDAANNWTDATAAWKCLRDGGTCTGISYPVAGMQSLVDAVRGTGATNVLLVAGLTWTNDLTQWLTYKPSDPAGNIVASWHSYNFNACVTVACWDSQIGTVAAQVPVTAGEIGQNTCAHDYIDQVMAWADKNAVGYLAWTWNAWGICGSSGNVLIENVDGTPTKTYGEGFKAHLLTVTP